MCISRQRTDRAQKHGVMNKEEAQLKLVREPFALGYYRHHKGGAYVVFSVTVHEATGEVLIHYFSVLKHTRWTRSRKVFQEFVVKPILRFTWWRPASREELFAAAAGGPEELRRVFGDAAG